MTVLSLGFLHPFLAFIILKILSLFPFFKLELMHSIWINLEVTLQFQTCMLYLTQFKVNEQFCFLHEYYEAHGAL